MRLEPAHLVTFSGVAEYGNISRAAKALRLSQPAMSGQLKSRHDVGANACPPAPRTASP
ncbi:helix-turn-helix domain-containing protein [Deinococcus navajonensis]|uniref:LysR family transcriptional regulator n=1 Tax=Deinococcus navajonensis TaxID=309884 RepID=A0ABV8XJL4_9DEIO